MRRVGRLLVAASLACSSAPGCALTSKGEAISPRYFSPEAAPDRTAQRGSEALELRLGRVSSAAHLDERISYRLSESEVGFYEDQRWTEIPEVYLRRALERDLFEQRGLQRVVTGRAPTLDVELVAFEEVRGSPNRVRVKLIASLSGERRSLLERDIELTRPVDPQPDEDAPQRRAAALAIVLAEAVASLGAEVTSRLRTEANPPSDGMTESGLRAPGSGE